MILKSLKINKKGVSFFHRNENFFGVSKNGVLKIRLQLEHLFMKANSSLYNSYVNLFYNKFFGIEYGFYKELRLYGVGYRAWLMDNNLYMQLGFNNLIMCIFDGILVKARKNKIILYGIDKAIVNMYACSLKGCRAPDSYRGKGIRYKGEVLKLKVGKQR